jgi:hypothetical protein
VEKVRSSFPFATTVFTVPFTLILATFLFAGIESRQYECALGSSFIMGVLLILSVRSMPEVLWIYAAWIVASVTDFFAFRNWAFKFFVDKSVRQTVPSFAIFSPSNLPVPRAQLHSSIVPATCFKIYINPE